MVDVWTALQARRRSNPGAPLVTFVDAQRGDRVELSGTSVENAAAKIANALRDEFDVEAGAAVTARLPLHWQRTAWCAGLWTAGAVIVLDPAASADLLVVDERTALASPPVAPTVLAVSLHPFGLPIPGDLPVGVQDATLAVRAQPDAYLFEPPQAALEALHLAGTLLTQDDVWNRAGALAEQWHLDDGGRLLVTEDVDDLDAWIACLAVPLVSRGSVVLAVGEQDIDRLVDAERVTAIAAPRP